jgi:hypothetical protein
MTNLKGKKKNLSEVQQTKPVQLELFELDDQNSNDYSNTIEIYDMMPKYNFSPVTREKGKFVDSLPILAREFMFRKRAYNLNILPAAIVDKKTGKTVYYYPSQREELVEDVLRKLSASKGRGIYLDGEAGVKFTLYEIQQELRKIKHGYDINEIKQAIEICSKSIIEIVSKDGNEISYTSNIFPLVALEKGERADGKNMAVVQFHPLVTRSINEGTFRLINYERMMSMKMALSRWLHKRISHLFNGATVHNPYNIKLSTIVRDHGMKVYKTISERIRQVSKAMDELKKNNIISEYRIEKNKEKNKILDATYYLYVSEEFVADIKKANKVKNLEIEEEKKNNISVEDVVELRKEIEKNIYGLSRTIINGHIARVSSKEKKEELMSSLKAAEEWINKNEGKTDFHPAQITMAAIKNKYLPKSSIVKKEKEIINQPSQALKIKDKTKNRDEEWVRVKTILQTTYSKEIFEKWLSSLELKNSYETEIIMIVSTKFLRDWIKKEYLKKIKELWIEQGGEIKKVTIISEEEIKGSF